MFQDQGLAECTRLRLVVDALICVLVVVSGINIQMWCLETLYDVFPDRYPRFGFLGLHGDFPNLSLLVGSLVLCG